MKFVTQNYEWLLDEQEGKHFTQPVIFIHVTGLCPDNDQIASVQSSALSPNHTIYRLRGLLQDMNQNVVHCDLIHRESCRPNCSTLRQQDYSSGSWNVIVWLTIQCSNLQHWKKVSCKLLWGLIGSETEDKEENQNCPWLLYPLISKDQTSCVTLEKKLEQFSV